MSDKQPYYITTPIYYVNGLPHIGHTYTTIVCDAMARYQRQSGKNVYFLTGTDEHGDKIVQAAEKEGKTPREYVDGISGAFRNTWDSLEIDYDQFIRTTDTEHKKIVGEILQKIFDQGDIYLSEYEGLYCVGCERYLTEKELNEDGQCPDHKTKPEVIKEENYFFKLQKYLPQLEKQLQENPEVVRPKQYYNEVLGTIQELKKTKEDLSISRPKSRLDWGIELPFDNRFVTYVWFDALLNYISAIGGPESENFKTYWPHSTHVIAKDILKPHGIFWPSMLLAAGIPNYQKLMVHGYWLGWGEAKMSKSLGNAADPVELAEKAGGIDLLRYFLLREMAFGSDSKFSEVAIEHRVNIDLANGLGNLLQRTLSMIKKYFEGEIVGNLADHECANQINEIIDSKADGFHENFASFKFHMAYETVFEWIGLQNQIIEENKPWAMAKENSPDLRPLLETLLKGILTALFYLQPVLPERSKKIFDLLQQTDLDRFPRNISEIQLPSIKLEEWPIYFPRLSLVEKEK